MVDVNRYSFFRRIDIYAEVGCSDCNPIKSDAIRCKSSWKALVYWDVALYKISISKDNRCNLWGFFTDGSIFLVHFWCIFLDIKKAHKIDNQFLVGFVERKERDSNPRTREDQRFSRPPHSTTLPSFQAQRYNLFSILQNFYRKVEFYLDIFYLCKLEVKCNFTVQQIFVLILGKAQ